jgi:hypothetical protein
MTAKLVRIALCTALALLTACAWLRPGSPAPVEEPAPSEAPLDTIRVKGDTLRGWLLRLGTASVEFETVYGEGTLEIAYDDVEELVAHGRYVIRHGETFETTQGPLLGFEGGEVLVGSEQELEEAAVDSVERVAVEEIKRAVREEDFDDSLLTRLRTRYNHWNADLDIGFVLEEGAVDKRKVNIGMDVERRLAPTRFTYELNYAFENQKKSEQPRATTKDELFSTARLEYEFSQRFRRAFVFGLLGGEWDKPRGVAARTFPAGGLGYRIFDSETLLLQLFGGFGWAFTDYKGAGDEDWAAGLLGGEVRWSLPRDAQASLGLFYMPKLENPGDGWLYRSRFLFTMPIWDPLTLRFRITDVNDNNPAPNIGNNKFTTTWGFGLRF